MEFAQRLYNKKGYEVVITCSKGADPSAYGVNGCGKKASLIVEYLGVPGGSGRSMEPEAAAGSGCEEGPKIADDPYAMRYFASPWKDRRKEPVHKVGNDGEGRIWTGEWSYFSLKDPAVFENGIELRYTVPAETAKQRPVMKVIVNGTAVWSGELSEAGTFTECFDAAEAGRAAADYLAESQRLAKILLEEFIRVCEEKEVPYYLFCGTAIGAVRDGGLIEWDDDVDVAVTREGYDRLLKEAKDVWDGSNGFALVTPRDLGENVFLDYMTRLIYLKEPIRNTLYDRVKERVRPDILDRACLDIYILENGAKTQRGHDLQKNAILAVYGLLLAHRDDFRSDEHLSDGKWKIRALRILNRTGKRCSVRRLLDLYERICRRYARGDSPYVFMSNGYIRCVFMRFKKQWFAEGRSVLLMGREMKIPKDAEAYLTAMYGDYRKLPGSFQRRPGHNDLMHV